MPRSRANAKARERIRQAFLERGYVRSPPDRRRSPDTHRGYELRIGAHTKAEVRDLVRDLRSLGFSPGKPFPKGRMWRIPIYGADMVERLLALVDGRDE